MSQDAFPFADTGDPAPFFEEGDAEHSKRAALVAGGLVAALMLGAGAYLFLGRGSEEAVDSAFAPTKGLPRAVAAGPKKPVAAGAKKLPVAYEEQIGRDPFKALYVVPVAAPAAAAPAAAPAPVGAPGATTGASSTTVTPVVTERYTLKLVSISKPSSGVRFTTWLVDGEKKTVLPAQRFGKYGELVVLAFSKNAQGVVDRAILQVGDDSPMEVTVGESNSVL